MFTPKTLSFLRSLKRNNKREWFHERKDQYELHCRGPMIAIVERLAEDFRSFAPEMLADPKVSLVPAVPRHAVQRRQDAAEDAHRRHLSESRARPHERRRLLLRSGAAAGCGSAAGCGGRTRRSCSWCASTSSPTIASSTAIVDVAGVQEARRPAGRHADARAARVREGSSGRGVPAVPAVHGVPRGAGGVRDEEGFLQAAARHAGDDHAAGALSQRAAGRVTEDGTARSHPRRRELAQRFGARKVQHRAGGERGDAGDQLRPRGAGENAERDDRREDRNHRAERHGEFGGARPAADR